MPSGGNILSACPSLRVDEAASRRHAPPHGELTKRLAKLTAKRPKTEADHREIARVEWHGGLWLSNGMPCIPAEALQATFRSAAKTERRGQPEGAGVLVAR